MTTPNFEAMTVAELRAYAIEHRDDLQALALRELLNRRDPHAPKYNFPNTGEGWAQTAEIFRCNSSKVAWGRPRADFKGEISPVKANVKPLEEVSLA
jgi:hypothetical protein